MRVLHLLPSLDPETGGPARSVPALCRALQGAGVDVWLYTFRRKGGAVTVSPDSEAFRIRCFRPLPGSRQLPSLSFYQRMREDVHHFDVVHLHSLWNPAITIAGLACRQAGVPYLLSPRGMLQDDALCRRQTPKRIYYRLWERRTIVGASALHFFTEAEALNSQRLLNGKMPFVVIPNGIDPCLAGGIRAGKFRKTHPLLQGKRIMIFVGRLHWSKGLDLQARVLALLVREFPDLVWVLVGPDEGEWAQLSRQVYRMGLEQHLLWTGPLSQGQCFEALADADLFLLTSRHEAHSMAMNEALAIGVPLVIAETVRFDAVREWGAGYVVPRDPQSLAAAITDILKHPRQANEMREAGRRLAAERLAWPKVAEAMLKAFESILARWGQKPRTEGDMEGDNG